MAFDFTVIAERKIQEAIEEGQLDNLPGKGKPIKLDNLPPHLRILKNANVLPDWMQLDLEIDRMREECARTWRRIERDYQRRSVMGHAKLPAFIEWHARTRAYYLQQLKDVNDDIIALNMKRPIAWREQIPYRLKEEMARFDAAFPAPGSADVDQTKEKR